MYNVFSYIHLLLCIDKTFLPYLLILLLHIPVEHILHLFELCLLEIFLKPIPLVVFLSFFSVLFYIFPFVSLHDIILELSLYIPLVLILSIILLILYFYCLLY